MNSGPDAFAALRRHGSHNAMFQLVGKIALHRDCHAAVGCDPLGRARQFPVQARSNLARCPAFPLR
jgi:hypothetical protein